MQHSFTISLVLIAIFFSPTIWAKEAIYFLPEKNKLQILPQKFEYNLLNNSTIKIGDIVIDSNNLSLQLNLDPSETTFTFSWPASLFREAELVIFNNYGKAIKSYSVTKNQIKLVIETNQQDVPLQRENKAIFKTPPVEESLIEEVRHLPFFKFCLQKKEKNTRIDLCSVEFYLSSKDDKPIIKIRSENKKKAEILVNNIEVGEQGVVFLNDHSESISFKGQSESGAKLEIETRLKPVDFKDVVISNDGSNLLLTGSGSFPVSEKNVKMLNEQLWQIRLPMEFPVFYIQGEGGIPFRQEFFIRGALPTEALRTFSSNLISTTYRHSERITLEIPKNTAIFSKDANSKIITNNSNQRIEWLITGLEKRKNSKRLLYLKQGENEFAIYQSIFRAPAFEAHISATYLTAEKISSVNFGLNYWLNNKYSGLGMEFNQAISKSATIEKWSTAEFSYFHRLQKGINFQDPFFYLTGNIRSSSIGDLNFSQIGLGFGRRSLIQTSVIKFMTDWMDWNLKYYLGAKSKESEIKYLIKLDFRLYKELRPTYLLNYGIDLQSYSTANSDALKTSQLDLRIGLNYLF